jgi:hypothetical protein
MATHRMDFDSRSFARNKIYERNSHSKFTPIKINMQQLTNAEEQVMEHLWKLEKAFMKDLLEAYRNQNLQPQPSLLY